MNNNHIGKKIKLLRTWFDLNQSEFGQRVGYSLIAVHKWENGATPRLEAVQKIEAAFNVKLDSIELVYESMK